MIFCLVLFFVSIFRLTLDYKIELLLCLNLVSYHMCMTNEDLVKERGNGTLRRCVEVKLKEETIINRRIRRIRRCRPRKLTIWNWLNLSIGNHQKEMLRQNSHLNRNHCQKSLNFLSYNLMKTGGFNVAQAPVNSKIASTRHKLQGVAKDAFLVNDWSCRRTNWIYHILSRAHTRMGIFLGRPLDLEK